MSAAQQLNPTAGGIFRTDFLFDPTLLCVGLAAWAVALVVRHGEGLDDDTDGLVWLVAHICTVSPKTVSESIDDLHTAAPDTESQQLDPDTHSIVPMKAIRLLRLGVAIAILPVLPLSLSGCACTTVGYVNTDPIAVTIEGPVPEGVTVAACLDEGCIPTEVEVADDGHFEIPQEDPYRRGDSVNPPVVARVVVTASDGTILVDQQLDVRTARDNPVSYCPGPFHYEDLTLTLP